MAHHKRRRPKHQRNGCLYCKPHKDNHAKNKEHASVARVLQDNVDDLWEPTVISSGGALTVEMIEASAQLMIDRHGTLNKEEEEQVKRLTRK